MSSSQRRMPMVDQKARQQRITEECELEAGFEDRYSRSKKQRQLDYSDEEASSGGQQYQESSYRGGERGSRPARTPRYPSKSSGVSAQQHISTAS